MMWRRYELDEAPWQTWLLPPPVPMRPGHSAGEGLGRGRSHYRAIRKSEPETIWCERKSRREPFSSENVV
jgi:hypothetical protein